MSHLDEKLKAFLSGVEKRRGLLEKETRAKAHSLFREYFEKLCLDFGNTPQVGELFPIKPETIIKDILKIDYLEPQTISSEGFEDIATGGSTAEIAGLIDRGNNRVVIAGKFKPEWKRFTAAHEIGHWLLHPSVIYLRERPLKRSSNAPHNTGHDPLQPDVIRRRERPVTGHELANSKRPPEERQADLFAAELLMPTFHLVKTFFYRFGGPVDGTKPNEEMVSWLSMGSKKEFDAFDFSKWSPRGRSQLIAQVSSFRMRHFTSLAKRYGVSVTAMAIQLEDLGLVK